MSKHIEIRNALNELDVAQITKILNSTPLSSNDRTLMELRYLKRHDMAFIADYLGYSVSTIKRRHRVILDRIRI